MEPTDDNILALIAANGGIQAKVIASKLGTDKKTINSALYSRLRTKVKQDKKYGWWLKETKGVEGKDEVKVHDTPVTKLCNLLSNGQRHRMNIFEEVNEHGKNGQIVGKIKRIRTKVLLRLGALTFVIGIISLINGLDWQSIPNATEGQNKIGRHFIMSGITLILTITPCLFIYPLIRALSSSEKDSWKNVIITFVTEEFLKHKLINSLQKRDKKKHY